MTQQTSGYRKKDISTDGIRYIFLNGETVTSLDSVVWYHASDEDRSNSPVHGVSYNLEHLKRAAKIFLDLGLETTENDINSYNFCGKKVYDLTLPANCGVGVLLGNNNICSTQNKDKALQELVGRTKSGRIDLT